MAKFLTHKGFSLLESLLVLLVLILAGLGVYKMFSPSSTQAAIKMEQNNVNEMVEGIFNAYTTASDFSTISTATTAGILGLDLDSNNTLNTRVKTRMTVEPSTTLSANDSFDLNYESVSTPTCIGLTKALSSASNGVFIGNNTSIQTVDGKIANENQIIQQCGANATTKLTFRFMGQKRSFTATTMNSCICAPTSETQNIACPSGSSGTITQRRTGLCTGGTPACPSLSWSSWSTTLNTCAVNGTTLPTPPTVVIPPQTCIPSVETQTVACPVGQVGGILQQRSRSCPANTWSGWMQVSSSCQTDTARNACTPRTVQSTDACPAGQGGQESFEQTSICDANGNETWGPIKLIGSTCTASCVSTGTCCVVSRQNRSITGDCGIGRYGRLEIDQTRTSTCLTATSTPVWPSTWIDLRSSGCNACPADTTATDTQDVTMTRACPAGQNGVISWISHQVRTRVYTYSCNSQPSITSLPAPNITTSGWTEVSRSSEVNSCMSASCSGPSSETQWVGQSSGCPAGQTGTMSWEKEQVRTRTCNQVPANTGSYTVTSDTGSGNSQPYGCRNETHEDQKAAAAQAICISNGAGYSSTIDYCSDSASHTYFGAMNFTCTSGTQGSWSGWGSWLDTGVTRNHSNSCVAAVVCSLLLSHDYGTRDVSDAYYSISYTANGIGGGCDASMRNDGKNGFDNCKGGANGVLSISQWEQQARDGETYSTSGSQSGWEGSFGEFWGWDDFTYVRASGSACSPCSAPAATNTAITRAVANENQTVACPAGQTGSVTQTRTRTENGTRRTTWTCPGPTSSTSDTWLGTYNYGGWTNVSSSCVVATPSASFSGGWVTTYGNGSTMINSTINQTGVWVALGSVTNYTASNQGPLRASWGALNVTINGSTVATSGSCGTSPLQPSMSCQDEKTYSVGGHTIRVRVSATGSCSGGSCSGSAQVISQATLYGKID